MTRSRPGAADLAAPACHRHLGWEIPIGRVEEGESPDQAAAREVEEETGWRPAPPRLLVASQPSNGSVDSVHYLFRADGARYAGPPSDRTEADRIEWIPLADIPGLIDQGAIVSGPTLIADSHRQKGTRPDFSGAARPEAAEPLYERFSEALRGLGLHVETGVFGARMTVEIVNDGPVTIVLDV